MHLRNFVIASFVILLVWSTAQAQALTGIVNNNANLRAGPGTTYAIVGSAQAGQTVTITGTNDDGNWYQLANNAWIAAFLVDRSTAPTPTVAAVSRATVADPPSVFATGATASRNANLRGGPGTSYPVVGGTSAGAALNPVGRNLAGDWLKLDTGEWIAAFLVDNAPAGLPIIDGEGPPPVAPVVDAPPPPAPMLAPTPSPTRGCHPSYDPCVPIASDVDCEGGSGNGPAYVRGPVRVIGPDVYGLDRDGDGIGCE